MQTFKSEFVTGAHSDLIPLMRIASVEDLGLFTLAQLRFSLGEELPELTPVAKALFETSMLERFENNHERQIERGKQGGAPKGNKNASRKQAEVVSETTKKQPETTGGCFETIKNNQKTTPISVSETITETVKKHIVGQSPTACTAARLNESQKPDDFIKAAAVDKAERKADIERIVAHLNKTIGTRFSPTSKDTAKHINARLNEGFKLDDFITVIDKKAAEWVGTDRAQYLRPETLFGTKFEGYFNAPYPQRNTGTLPKGENYGKHGGNFGTRNSEKGTGDGFEHLRSLEI